MFQLSMKSMEVEVDEEAHEVVVVGTAPGQDQG